MGRFGLASGCNLVRGQNALKVQQVEMLPGQFEDFDRTAQPDTIEDTDIRFATDDVAVGTVTSLMSPYTSPDGVKHGAERDTSGHSSLSSVADAG